MSKSTANTCANAFFKARKQASTHNEALSSREGAADIMAIDRGRLYRIENGIANPYPEEIKLMCDLYNAPELQNYYCRRMCPLGDGVPEVTVAGFDRIMMQTVATLQRIDGLKESLIEIAADGMVDENEKEAMNKILKDLDEMIEAAHSLKFWAKKNL